MLGQLACLVGNNKFQLKYMSDPVLRSNRIHGLVRVCSATKGESVELNSVHFTHQRCKGDTVFVTTGAGNQVLPPIFAYG
jgi:hypothetical protein